MAVAHDEPCSDDPDPHVSARRNHWQASEIDRIVSEHCGVASGYRIGLCSNRHRTCSPSGVTCSGVVNRSEVHYVYGKVNPDFSGSQEKGCIVRFGPPSFDPDVGGLAAEDFKKAGPASSQTSEIAAVRWRLDPRRVHGVLSLDLSHRQHDLHPGRVDPPGDDRHPQQCTADGRDGATADVSAWSATYYSRLDHLRTVRRPSGQLPGRILLLLSIRPRRIARRRGRPTGSRTTTRPRPGPPPRPAATYSGRGGHGATTTYAATTACCRRHDGVQAYDRLPVPYGFTAWLNGVRAQHGLAPVGYDPNLASWAATNNAQQNARGLGHHIMGPSRRQNCAMGNSASIGSMWMSSAAHRANMLASDIRYIGIAASGSYWTLNAY